MAAVSVALTAAVAEGLADLAAVVPAAAGHPVAGKTIKEANGK
jgi:hypothetical protein